jgi:hypothetical protein
MTDKLNEAEFDGWLPTGSHNTYALRFRNETRGSIYALWSLRGVRSVTLQLSADAVVRVTDSMNNGRDIPSTNRLVTFDTDPSVRYVTFVAPAVTVAAVTVGEPRHPDSVQPADAAPVADLGDGSWRFTNERDGILESNHWAIMHYPGRFSASFEDDPARGRVLVSTLEKQEVPHELMPWYNVLRPAKPVVLPGAPSKLGLWARGAGDWGRVIYVLRDAAGERWTSIGTQDQYNCDDSHSWSMFCFDGWRFLEFELPGHTGWDRFRKAGTTWWRGGDGGDPEKRNVVDLPLTLEAVIVEQRTHILYVNDIQPVATNRVALGGLFALYDSAADRGDQALRASRLRMPLPEGAPPLPNPIAAMAAAGKGSATAIQGLRQPDHYYDGTRMHVDFREALPLGRRLSGRPRRGQPHADRTEVRRPRARPAARRGALLLDRLAGRGRRAVSSVPCLQGRHGGQLQGKISHGSARLPHRPLPSPRGAHPRTRRRGGARPRLDPRGRPHRRGALLRAPRGGALAGPRHARRDPRKRRPACTHF